MPIPVNQIRVVEIALQGTAAAGGSNNRAVDFIFHYRRTATVLAVPKAGIDAAFQTAIATPIAAALNARFLQSRNTVRFIDDALDQPFPFAHALPGLIAGDSMATSLSAFLLMTTGLRGKSYRGGKHLFPMSESDTTSGTDDVFNAGCLGRLATIANAILAGFTDATGNVWVPSIVSRKLSQLKTNPTTVTGNDCNAVFVNKRVGSMRHRKVKSQY